MNANSPTADESKGRTMSFITRGILRWGLIGGLALVGVSLLIGPERVAVGLSQIRMKAQNLVDSAMDDPVALRRQLERLAEQYPDRIAEVEGEIGEVEHQIALTEHDIEVARLVVANTTDDMQTLKTLIARAEDQAASTARTVALRFQGVRFDIDEARQEGYRINNVRSNFQDRLAADEFQVNLLREQKDRLVEIHRKLESEYDTYLTQLHQLDREIDAIARNDRLIKLIEEQQATLKSYERFGDVENIHQLQSKLAELRTIQQAQLERLEKAGIRRDYEEEAKYQLGTQHVDDNGIEKLFELEEKGDTDNVNETDDSIAWAGPLVIEE
jgi:chromosome segregation ATPase